MDSRFSPRLSWLSQARRLVITHCFSPMLMAISKRTKERLMELKKPKRGEPRHIDWISIMLVIALTIVIVIVGLMLMGPFVNTIYSNMMNVG